MSCSEAFYHPPLYFSSSQVHQHQRRCPKKEITLPSREFHSFSASVMACSKAQDMLVVVVMVVSAAVLMYCLDFTSNMMKMVMLRKRQCVLFLLCQLVVFSYSTWYVGSVASFVSFASTSSIKNFKVLTFLFFSKITLFSKATVLTDLLLCCHSSLFVHNKHRQSGK